jgi:hypothetical protein
MIDPCLYQDPGEAPCGKPGRRLTLRTDLGGLAVRTLCREHSDWQEAPEAEAVRPRRASADRDALAALGVRW